MNKSTHFWYYYTVLPLVSQTERIKVYYIVVLVPFNALLMSFDILITAKHEERRDSTI